MRPLLTPLGRIPIRYVLALACLQLTACAQIPRAIDPQVLRAVQEKSVCCADLQSIPYVPLGPDETLDLTIDDSTPVYSFPEGKSPFVAVGLSGVRRGSLVVIDSIPVGFMVATSQVIQPNFLFLDKAGNVIERGQAMMAATTTASGLGGVCLFWRGRIRVPPRSQRLILYTASNRFDRGISGNDGCQSGFGSPARTIGIGPYGSIKLRFRD